MQGTSPQHRVLILGGGVAGLEIATALGRQQRRRRAGASLAVTLIDKDTAHVWKPMLHTIAAGTQTLGQQQTAYAFAARHAGFFYEPGELGGLDRSRRHVQLAPIYAADGRLLVPARSLPYDTLILAVGSQANDFRTPGVRTHCMMIDSRRQAAAFHREVKTRLLQSLGNDTSLDIAIVGGGATGVELAAELVRLTELAAGYGAAGLAGRVHITLVESSPRLLGAFPEDISAATQQRLEQIGIRVLTATKVVSARADGFMLGDGTHLPASLMVWAAGVKAADVLDELDGLETNRNRQLVVMPSLETTRDPAILAVGDCASLTLPGASHALPPTAQIAHQQAQHVIRHLPAAISDGTTMPRFTPRDFGALVALGDYDAFGSLGKFGMFKGATIKGRLAQLSHALLYRSHQMRIHGVWRGSLLWLNDRLSRFLRASLRLD